jgi:acyl-coenzyme A synthetase/AMP-(fatty) acid ligase
MGEVAIAIVVLKPGAHATEEEIINYVKEHLTRFKAPMSVELWKELPKGGTRKALKREIRKLYWEGHEKAVQ